MTAVQPRSVDDATPTSVCVAIVLYENGLPEIWRGLRALFRTVELALADPTLDLRVVRIRVGDCSSTPLLADHDLSQLRGGRDERIAVEYEWFGRNLGHSRACNALAEGAAEDALLMLNPDTYVAPRLLAALLRRLAEPAVAAADARQIPCEHPKWFDPIVGDQSWASGACLLVRTAPFHAADGFDGDSFPSYVNDVDLSWRLRLAGGRVVHEPNAVVFHDKRLTAAAGVEPTAIEVYQGTLARLLLATKYGRADVVAETIAAVHAHGGSEHARAVRDFRVRDRAGLLPAALPAAAGVAEFTDGEYGRRRF